MYLREYEDAHDVAPAPFIGIRRLLGRLKDREIPMAIVTGKGPRSAALSLDHWGIADRFDAVEAGSAEGNIKDRNMRRVLGHWAADPGQVVAVGDAPTDVHAARAAGVVPVAAAWASTAHPGRLAAERPDHVFEAVARFSDWLLA